MSRTMAWYWLKLHPKTTILLTILSGLVENLPSRIQLRYLYQEYSPYRISAWKTTIWKTLSVNISHILWTHYWDYYANSVVLSIIGKFKTWSHTHTHTDVIALNYLTKSSGRRLQVSSWYSLYRRNKLPLVQSICLNLSLQAAKAAYHYQATFTEIFKPCFVVAVMALFIIVLHAFLQRVIFVKLIVTAEFSMSAHVRP